MKFFRNSKKGFTLIELLVVIAIISLLSSIVLSSLNSARAKGRDAKRAAEVHELKTAMEMYYHDNGFYPSIYTDHYGYSTSLLATPLSPYLKQIPDDPTGTYLWQYVRAPIAENAYGLLIYSEKLGGYCGSGVNFNPGWWGIGSAMCPF